VEMMPFWREAPSKSDSVQGTSDTGSESEHWATLVTLEFNFKLLWHGLTSESEQKNYCKKRH
jgi:hypothetical protein